MGRSNMYDGAKTWSPFKGCLFDCIYCRYSFQKDAKRLQQICQTCYDYKPHFHPERLSKIPSAKIIFACGHSDLSFAEPEQIIKIIDAIKERDRPGQTFYFQSKAPACFKPFLKDFPDNVVLLTTLETNRDEGYQAISKAPPPSIRFEQFKALEYPRKVLTLEPLLKFDHNVMVEMVREVNPEYVWLGINSKRRFKALQALPEPTADEFWTLHDVLSDFVEVKAKSNSPERMTCRSATNGS
jgi:hypothetical protein